MEKLQSLQIMKRILSLAVLGFTLTALYRACWADPRNPTDIVTAAGPVIIRNLTNAGAFEVENAGPDLDLAWSIAVQREQDGAWVDEVTDIGVVRKCGESNPGSCVRLAHGTRFLPLPWNGLSCGSQCPASCRPNICLGPGRFRFVVASCDGKQRFAGPAFFLPAYHERR